jgi:hypothetical protein
MAFIPRKISPTASIILPIFFHFLLAENAAVKKPSPEIKTA